MQVLATEVVVLREQLVVGELVIDVPVGVVAEAVPVQLGTHSRGAHVMNQRIVYRLKDEKEEVYYHDSPELPFSRSSNRRNSLRMIWNFDWSTLGRGILMLLLLISETCGDFVKN